MARRKKRSKRRKAGTGWGAARKLTRAGKKHYAGLMPEKVIEGHARKLKRNPRALAIYRRVIG